MHAHKHTVIKKSGSVLVSVMLMGLTTLAMAMLIFSSELQIARNNESLLDFMKEDSMASSSEHYLVDWIVLDAEKHCEAMNEESLSLYLNQLQSGLLKECEGLSLRYDGRTREFTTKGKAQNGMRRVSVYVMKLDCGKIHMFRKEMHLDRI